MFHGLSGNKKTTIKNNSGVITDVITKTGTLTVGKKGSGVLTSPTISPTFTPTFNPVLNPTFSPVITVMQSPQASPYTSPPYYSSNVPAPQYNVQPAASQDPYLYYDEAGNQTDSQGNIIAYAANSGIQYEDEYGNIVDAQGNIITPASSNVAPYAEGGTPSIPADVMREILAELYASPMPGPSAQSQGAYYSESPYDPYFTDPMVGSQGLDTSPYMMGLGDAVPPTATSSDWLSSILNSVSSVANTYINASADKVRTDAAIKAAQAGISPINSTLPPSYLLGGNKILGMDPMTLALVAGGGFLVFTMLKKRRNT